MKAESAKTFNKQHVRKGLCPSDMLWVELIIFFQPERNIKHSKNRNGHIRSIFFGADMPRATVTYLLETS